MAGITPSNQSRRSGDALSAADAPVALAVHSRTGFSGHAASDRLPERIAAMVYVDSARHLALDPDFEGAENPLGHKYSIGRRIEPRTTPRNRTAAESCVVDSSFRNSISSSRREARSDLAPTNADQWRTAEGLSSEVGIDAAVSFICS